MLKNGTIIDRYMVDAVLGSGGTAVVYRVKHMALGTHHALKVLSVTSDVIRERMLQEGRVQATLRHPNVVVVSDVLEIGEQPGLLMEYIEGPSLQKAMREFKLPLEAAEALFVGMVAGVQAAHELGFIHRDMKPANVLLKQTESGFVPKVTDFGLAKILDEGGEDSGRGKTRAGVAMGTPAYMASEQIRDASNVDRRADIFSLGCILYELCVGQRAFPGDDAIRIYNAIMKGDYEPPLNLKPELPARVDSAIRGCLVVDRAQRIPDCATLLAVLRGDETWEASNEIPDFEEDPPTIETARPASPNAPTMLVAIAGLEEDDPTSIAGEAGRVVAKLNRFSNVDDTILNDNLQPELDPLYGPLGNSIVPSGDGMATVLQPDVEPEPTIAPVVEQKGGLGLMGGGILLMLGVGVVAFAVGGLFVSYLVGQDPSTGAADPSHATHEASEQNSDDTQSGEPSKLEEPASVPTPAPDSNPAEVAVVPAPVVSIAPDQPSMSAPTGKPVLDAGRTTVPVKKARPKVVPVTVKLLSKPPTAGLSIDGTPSRRTPAKLELMPGSYDVEMTSRDQVGRFRVTVTANGVNKWCYAFIDAKMHTGSCP